MCRPIIPKLFIVALVLGSTWVRGDLVHRWEFEGDFIDSEEGLEGLPSATPH